MCEYACVCVFACMWPPGVCVCVRVCSCNGRVPCDMCGCTRTKVLCCVGCLCGAHVCVYVCVCVCLCICVGVYGCNNNVPDVYNHICVNVLFVKHVRSLCVYAGMRVYYVCAHMSVCVFKYVHGCACASSGASSLSISPHSSELSGPAG